MDRRWENIPAEQIEHLAEGLKPGAYLSDWMSADTDVSKADAVLGKDLHFSFSNDNKCSCRFGSVNNLSYSEDGTAPVDCFYRILPAPGHPELVFIQFYLDGQVPATCVQLVLDLDTGYCVRVKARIGSVPAYPREVTHDIDFGMAEEIFAAGKLVCAGQPPHFTDDLTGRAIMWQMPDYTGKPPIKHIYLSQEYYAIRMTRPDGTCFMSADPADYVKIKDGVYLVSAIEERRSGIQLTFLINTDTLEDIVGHFGISAGNEKTSEEPRIVCTVMTGRKGRWVPMETFV